METIFLIVLLLVLWPLSFLAGRRVPERGKLFLLLLLAFACVVRFVQLVRVGHEPIASVLFAVLAVAFLWGAVRHGRRNAANPGV
jgi:uncharacterized membrane protein YhaH (DUF805 family)